MDHSSLADQGRSSNSTTGFFHRAVAFRSKSEGGSSDYSKGPLGLTTVHKPLEPVIADLVFVHGLGGGSKKTWTKNEDPALFWPETWLPREESFKNVRIHIFGYDANWDKESILNIHDFANDLLGWLKDCPIIPKQEQCPVVFVCHSLGGLVAKRAYILSKQLKEYQDLGRRIQAIFFLATPHRGSNMAKLLSRMLQVASGARPFVTDLHPNSVMIQSINEEFPRHCQDLHLHSFYETVPMSFGVKKIIVVPKDSAILGYENERSSFLSNANHREVCKFGSNQEPNYLAIRNGISSWLEELRSRRQLTRIDSDHGDQLWLKECLDINDTYDDDFQRVDSERIEGSCSWISDIRSFQKWRDSPEAQVFWLAANPGTGKTVTSGFVISHLTGLNKDCEFYFFNYSDKTKFSIALLLRSIAWQLANKHKTIFAYLLKQCKKDAHIAKADYRTTWRKLFLDGIFKLPLPKRQYLILDALDECANDSELVPLLMKAAELNVFRIFLTSRNAFDSYGLFCPVNLSIVSETIPQNSTTSDIRLYLQTNLHNLPALGPDRNTAREDMMQSILKKSSGCFLWVRLVLSELRKVHTSEEARQVLEEIPSDMDELYSRIVDEMSLLKRGKPLTKAILAWTACASRPLTTDELHEALQLDIKDNIDGVERSIASTCGQLINIDGLTSRVKMVHQTAREFLLRPNNSSEFSLDRKATHSRLAMTCLKYLSSSDMAKPKSRIRSSSQALSVKTHSPFLAYAANALPHHIAFVSSEDDDFLRALSKFLTSQNLLSWIEYISRNSNLDRLIQTGRALSQFLQRRSKDVVPCGKDVAVLDAWSVDLVRLVTKFGKNLVSSPASIYNLIPPFCPPDTALNKQFASSNRSIRVNGLNSRTWDDCSSAINYKGDTPTALAASPKMFAVGQKSGRIHIYQETSCQELQTLQHQAAVTILRFGDNGDVLASVSKTSICVWGVQSRNKLWRFEIETPCMDLSFCDHDQLLLVALKSNRFLIWDLASGSSRELTSWVEELDAKYACDWPLTASIGCGSTMLAVTYRGQDILVWDIEEESIYDIYGQDLGSMGAHAEKRSGVATPMSLVFSPVAESRLLATGYNDGEIVVFNTEEQTVQARAHANAHSLSSSPDGMTLACGNSAGIILIFEFESLKLLYRILSEEYSIRSLAFSSDSHRLLDIRGPNCRVWDPPVLRREISEEEQNSETVSVSTAPQDYLLDDTEDMIPITTLVLIDEEGAIVCGKTDGSVTIYDGQTGKAEQVLIQNSYGNATTCIDYDAQSKTLSIADIDSCMKSYCLTRKGRTWVVEELRSHRAGLAVIQILSNQGCTRFLISTQENDILLSINSDGGFTQRTMSWPGRPRYKWSIHPTNLSWLILIVDATLHFFSFDTLERLTPKAGIHLTSSVLPELTIRNVTSGFNGQIIATTFAKSLAYRSDSELLLWQMSDLTLQAETAVPIPRYQPLASQVDYIIGTYNQRLVFMHQDGWVCSADPQNFDVEFYDRHFFFPADWMSATTPGRLILGVFPRNGNVVFVQRDEVAVIQKGLEFFEGGQSKGSSKRPSLSRAPVSGSHSDPLSLRP